MLTLGMSALHVLPDGTLFARDYRIVRPLAEGGMSAVYVAEQQSSGKLRALKVLSGELFRDAESRAGFAQEARIGGMIRSGHVVEVIAAGIDEATDLPFIAMELLEGEDLTELVERRGPLPLHEVQEILGQLGDALAAAHDAGVVHRDLKPRNVFVAQSQLRGMPFVVKVLDFGISKLIAHSATSVGITRQLGSPLFMAPEQARTGARLRRSTDIWPLGLLAFFLMTGRYYWRSVTEQGVNLNALMMEIANEPLIPATVRAQEKGVRAEVPEGFDGWFARCVCRDPAGRFQHAREAMEALRGALDRGRKSFADGSAPTTVRALPTPSPSAAADLFEQEDTVPEARMPRVVPSAVRPRAPTPAVAPRVAAPVVMAPMVAAPVVAAPMVAAPMVAAPIVAAPVMVAAPVVALPATPSVSLPLVSVPLQPVAEVTRPTLAEGPLGTEELVRRWVLARRDEVLATVERAREGDARARVYLAGAGVVAVFLLALMFSGGGEAPVAVEAQRSNVELRFAGLRPGARVVVAGVPYYSEVAFAPRGDTPVTVRVEAPGEAPQEFTVLPDRDQRVAVPEVVARLGGDSLPGVPLPSGLPAMPVVQSVLVPDDAGPPVVPVPLPTVRPSTAEPARSTATPRSPGRPSAGTGRLAVGGDPPRCTVRLDGRGVGTAPVFLNAVSAGEHRVGCLRAGHLPRVQVVRVERGAEREVFFPAP